MPKMHLYKVPATQKYPNVPMCTILYRKFLLTPTSTYRSRPFTKNNKRPYGVMCSLTASRNPNTKLASKALPPCMHGGVGQMRELT